MYANLLDQSARWNYYIPHSTSRNIKIRHHRAPMSRRLSSSSSLKPSRIIISSHCIDFGIFDHNRRRHQIPPSCRRTWNNPEAPGQAITYTPCRRGISSAICLGGNHKSQSAAKLPALEGAQQRATVIKTHSAGRCANRTGIALNITTKYPMEVQEMLKSILSGGTV